MARRNPAIPRPYDPAHEKLPSASETGSEVCVRLDAGYILAICAMLERLLYDDAWQDDPATNTARAAEMQARLLEAVACEEMDMPYELRDNPNDPNEVQESLDGGQTWQQAFTKWSSSTAAGIAPDWYERWLGDRETYTSNGLQPKVFPPTWSTGDTYRDNQLCVAMEYFIRGVFATGYAIESDAISFEATLGSLAAGAVGVGAGAVQAGIVPGITVAAGSALAVYGLPFVIAAAGIGAVALGLQAIIAPGNAEDRWTEEARIEAALCCALENLPDNTLPSEVEFRDIFAPSDNPQCDQLSILDADQVDLLRATVRQRDGYIAFLRLLDDMALLPGAFDTGRCSCLIDYDYTLIDPALCPVPGLITSNGRAIRYQNNWYHGVVGREDGQGFRPTLEWELTPSDPEYITSVRIRYRQVFFPVGDRPGSVEWTSQEYPAGARFEFGVPAIGWEDLTVAINGHLTSLKVVLSAYDTPLLRNVVLLGGANKQGQPLFADSLQTTRCDPYEY